MTDDRTPTRPPPATRGRVLLCNIGRVGDTILRNAIVDSACRTYRTIDYLCGEDNAALLEGDPRINKVLVMRNSFSGLLQLLRTAVSRRYDAFIALKNHRSSTDLLLARLFRSRLKTGWNSDKQQPFHRDVRTVVAPSAHAVENMRRIGELAGLEPGEYRPSLVLAPGAVSWFRQNHAWERPYTLINLSATHPQRIWPVDNWSRYVRGCGLASETMLVNGVPGDRALVRQLCDTLPEAVPFEPRDFMDVAAAINDARRVLTVDTGVVHACSALDKPIVALYGGGQSQSGYGPLSTRQLVIEPSAGRFVPDIDPQHAIAETRRLGLP